MKDFLRRCSNFFERVMSRLEGALGGFSLGIVCALALTFSGLIKVWFFTHIKSAFVALLIYAIAFALCGGIGFVVGAIFPKVFRVVLIPFIPIWFFVFGGDSDGPVLSTKQNNADKERSSPK
jgi:hypothetical protein